MPEFTAPPRIDFGGGHVDNIALTRGSRGYLSSITIEPHIRLRDDGTYDMGGYREKSGLALSTTMLMLRLAAEDDRLSTLRDLSISEVAEELSAYENRMYDIEVGKGDAFPVVYGGFNCFECDGRSMRRMPFDVPREILRSFEDRILLLYSGIPSDHTGILEELYANYDSGEAEYREAYDALSNCGYAFAEALSAGDFDTCGRLLATNWQAEKQLSPRISSSRIDAIYELAMKEGALGGKLCGAGAGGYFIFYTHDRVRLLDAVVRRFPDCGETRYSFELRNIKEILFGE